MSDSDSDGDRPCFGQGAAFSGGVPSEHMFGSMSESTTTESSDFEEVDQPLAKKMKLLPEPEKTEGEEKEIDNIVAPFTTSVKKKAASYGKFATTMLAKMGYKEGKGLGKHGQGRTEIVEASKQRGRRGLGLHIDGFEPAEDVVWNSEMEEITSEEKVEWLPTCSNPIPDPDTMKTWMKEGLRSSVKEDETEFGDLKILKGGLACKSVFDQLESEEMRRARTKSNPYETIRGAIFQNRAAMKMANMDYMFDFIFTAPRDEEGRPVVPPHELLYFADICAGPGGFSEYVLWRKKLNAKGFGFTLKGPCDFKLEEFFTAPSEAFEPFYGVGGVEGDGDVYRPDNLIAFRKFVMENTDNKGVHFVMADGGFSVEGKENLQEILSKRLYLCQFLSALSILRVGGHFVCKLFDVYTTWSVGLVYLMNHIFKQVSIFKPVTSRPANSERYIICKHLKEGHWPVHNYMFEVNLELHKLGEFSQEDIVEVVPLDILKADMPFYNAMVFSNDSFGRKQVLNLKKIQIFAKNPDLHEGKQADMRKECLMKWKIPDETRSAPDKEDPGRAFQRLMNAESKEYLSDKTSTLDAKRLHSVKSLYDYRAMVLASKERHFILSKGRSHIFKWDGRGQGKWKKLETSAEGGMIIKLELPKDTLLEVEFVQELRGEGKGQRKVLAVHIIDVLMIYGDDMRAHHFNDRMERLKRFTKAINKPSRSDLAPIRVKDIFKLEHLEEINERLQLKLVKGWGREPRRCYCGSGGRAFMPSGIFLIKTVKDPWSMAWSRSNNKKYFYNLVTKQSTFELPLESIASYKDCHSTRLLWSWPSSEVRSSDSVQWEELIDFVKSKK
ncbi:cap-specific mRNA (nucleoside-2'-O-)-methyltransferase 1-like [Lineus longissimus]|uniref:cap-specific mRNA (nucleoside-2'-O-)-methyltransferase 1-like n=1 Tax=Lineus longissimus TaxID=88925 RepID=UPI002B4E95C8